MIMDSTSDVLKIVAYLFLLIAILGIAVAVYTSVYRRKKMKLVNHLEFITSIENIYRGKTQFLVVNHLPTKVVIVLIDKEENVLKEICNADFDSGEHPVDFDPAGLQPGKYYLSLKSDETTIVRRIEIV